MSALVKLGMLFAGGVTLGLVIPWGFGPGKPARPDDSAERTVNVRCIVEYGDGAGGPVQGQALPGKGGRRLIPMPDEDEPMNRPAARPVEVVIKPGQKGTPQADDLTVILRVKPCCNTPAAGDAPADRPMPGAM
ncbi:MAG TPA: hypothetical protein VKE94_21865 [Gemmataceae bacterium]|nr:hypothetical protein [Gemmataceae bacterium]